MGNSPISQFVCSMCISAVLRVSMRIGGGGLDVITLSFSQHGRTGWRVREEVGTPLQWTGFQERRADDRVQEHEGLHPGQVNTSKKPEKP